MTWTWQAFKFGSLLINFAISYNLATFYSKNKYQKSRIIHFLFSVIIILSAMWVLFISTAWEIDISCGIKLLISLKILLSGSQYCSVKVQWRSTSKLLQGQSSWAEGELKNASLHCLNDGCGWCGHSSDYQGHKLVCGFSLFLCPFHKYGCTEKALQKDLSDHMGVCSFSPTRCQWCSEWVQDIEVVRQQRIVMFNVEEYLSYSCRIIWTRKLP